MKEKSWSATSHNAFSFLPRTLSQENWLPPCLPSPRCPPNTSPPEALFYLTTIFLKDCHSEAERHHKLFLTRSKGPESKNPENAWTLNTVPRRSTRIFPRRLQL